MSETKCTVKRFQTEYDLECFLCKYPASLHGQGSAKIIGRQVSLASGRLDLLMLTDCLGRDVTTAGNVEVVELKNGPITYKAISQVLRYCFDIREMLNVEIFDQCDWDCKNHAYASIQAALLGTTDMYVTPVLVGTSIDKYELAACKTAGIVVRLYDIDENFGVQFRRPNEHNREDKRFADHGWLPDALGALKGIATVNAVYALHEEAKQKMSLTISGDSRN